MFLGRVIEIVTGEMVDLAQLIPTVALRRGLWLERTDMLSHIRNLKGKKSIPLILFYLKFPIFKAFTFCINFHFLKYLIKIFIFIMYLVL